MNDKYSPPLFVKDDTTILTNLKKGEANARYAILAVRDPLGFHDDPADVVGAYMEDVHEISRNPMYTVVSGRYKDAEIIVCSMGSGGPDAEIAILDLMQFSGCDTFIRLGTSGTQRDDLNVGDIVISSGAVRDEGLTKEYIAPQYPALSSYEVMLPMIEAAQKMGMRYHVGITRSNDSIYCGQGRAVMGYLPHTQEPVVEYWVNAGILNVERETAAILTLSELFGARGGAVNTICNSSVTKNVGVTQGVDDAIKVTLEGLALLARRDKAKEKAGLKYWVPSLETD